MKISMLRASLSLLAAISIAGCASTSESSNASSSNGNVDRRFTWKQMSLHYQDFAAPQALAGETQAVVFVHGWSCNASFWREQIPALRGKVRVLAVDLPGHGESDKPEIEYSIDLFARSVEATMRHAGVEKAVLVGHSMGTPVIRQVYRLFPEKVKALVAVDGALRPMMTDPKQIEEFVARFEGADYAKGVEKMVDSMFSPQAPPSLRDSVKATMASAPQHVGISAFRGMLDLRIWNEDAIAVPLLVINAKSPFWPADYEAFVKKLAPQAEYTQMEGVGHFLMLEKPEPFNAILTGFLQAQGVIR